jgi:hypothetical protein
MAKTYRQIYEEIGKVSPEQTRKDKQELIAEIGVEEYEKEYLRVAKENAAKRFTKA